MSEFLQLEESGLVQQSEKPVQRRTLRERYLGIQMRFWKHCPAGWRSSWIGKRWGWHIHALVRALSSRQQYFATFFLRNRPEMNLMCRLLEQKPRGAQVRIAILACSKGAEVYSILWAIRSARPDLDIRVHALDISPEIVEFASQGIYSLQPPPGEGEAAGQPGDVARTTHRDQRAPLFERVSEAEMEQIFEMDGDEAKVRPWLREGITWSSGDAGDPALGEQLGPQDLVVANRFLCHMTPPVAARCLTNIGRLVAPGGYLFVCGIDMDVRARVALAQRWKPVTEMICEIHDGDVSLREGWPLEYWALEPLRDDLPNWQMRYASAFQIGETI
ncbi:MAG TPA: CheR family methyltransferase [Acidobacteriaceae bacterium]|jgi:chemotaxis methyl-accepting protein methylase|nr:CheR family methyltransferase [Acidobacteriaceae bacterium]